MKLRAAIGRSGLVRGAALVLMAWLHGPPGIALAADGLSEPYSLAQVLQVLRHKVESAEPTEALSRANAALRLAADMKLDAASKAINEALQLDPRNSFFHFFNGFIYHLQARRGDAEKTGMALEGYRQAIRFDPNNWIAHDFLGLAHWEQRQYDKAQAAFAEVLLARPDDLEARARMMAASYIAGDPATACGMADQLAALPGGRTTSSLRASTVVYAACAEFGNAEATREVYARMAPAPTPRQLDLLDGRIVQWRHFHRQRANVLAARPPELKRTQLTPGVAPPAYPGGGSLTPLPGASPFIGGAPTGAIGGGFGFPGGGMGGIQGGQQDNTGVRSAVDAAMARPMVESAQNRMVLVDVVLVRTEDTVSTSKGVNLLHALSLQFGSAGAPAFSRVFQSATDVAASTLLTRAITVPALAYSLNLANANSNLNEVLARPTLAAVEGMKSEFFSGTSLNAAVVSGGSALGGSAVSVEKRYGVKLSVLPQILPNGMIKLAIDAARTFLKPPSANIGFTYKLEISEILASANVVMRIGDTLILGGLSEKESTNNRDGVPVLQDVPGVQYLFSQQAKAEFQRSVLILITPRAASYSWLSEETRAAIEAEGATPFTPSLDVLRARYDDWFKPYPNLASVFHHLNSAQLYREFRTGDVTLENWQRMKTTTERLRQAIEFLHY